MLPGIDWGAVKPLRFITEPGQDDDLDATTEELDKKGDSSSGKAGQTFLAGVQRRRMAAVKRAAELLEILPAEGESLHVILLGYFDLLNVVLALLDKVGSPCLVLRVATLALSKRNVSELAALVDAGKVKQLDCLTSDFQQRMDGEVVSLALLAIKKRGQRVAVAKSYCKLVTILLADGRRYVIEGSANLRTSRNMEQFALSRDAGLHAFYDGWLDEMVTKFEVRSAAEGQAETGKATRD